MKLLKVYAAALGKAGIEVLDHSFTGSGHLKLTVARPESKTITASVFCAHTPGDQRGTLNMVSDAKRALAVQASRWNGNK